MPYFVIFQAHTTRPSLTYETRFVCAVSLRPVYILPADPRKEYLAPEAASPRVSWSARPPQRAPAYPAYPGPQWRRPYQRVPRHSQWPGHCGTWSNGPDYPNAQCYPNCQRRQPSCHSYYADAAAGAAEPPSSHANAWSTLGTSKLGTTVGPDPTSNPETQAEDQHLQSPGAAVG